MTANMFLFAIKVESGSGSESSVDY